MDLSQAPITDLAAEITKRAHPDFRVVGFGDVLLDDATDEEIRDVAVDRGFEVFDEGESPFESLDEARSLLNRGDLRECLYAIERELPHEFAGLTDAVFKAVQAKHCAATTPDFGKLPKRVQAIIDTVRHGQTLCCHKHLNREGQTERLWFFEPSGKPATPKSAEAAIATSFLRPCGDGLFPNQSQTWRATP